MLSQIIAQGISKDVSRLDLILLPTEKCNLRCNYCYETFSLGRMSETVVTSIQAMISRRAPTLSSLTISWFGGEPLIAQDIIESVNEHCLKTSRIHGLRFSSSMTTNGVFLTNKNAKRLFQLGVSSYQITLDGDEDEHDRIRVGINRRGTFATIYANVKNLLSLKGVKVDLRLHVRKSNIQSICRLISKLGSDFASNPALSILVKPIRPLGGPNDKLLDFLEEDEEAQILANLSRHIKTEGLNAPRASCGFCYASFENSLVVRSDGRVAKCTVALEHDKNTVGFIDETGQVILDYEKFSTWTNALDSGDFANAVCPAKAALS